MGKGVGNTGLATNICCESIHSILNQKNARMWVAEARQNNTARGASSTGPRCAAQPGPRCWFRNPLHLHGLQAGTASCRMCDHIQIVSTCANHCSTTTNIIKITCVAIRIHCFLAVTLWVIWLGVLIMTVRASHASVQRLTNTKKNGTIYKNHHQ